MERHSMGSTVDLAVVIASYSVLLVMTVFCVFFKTFRQKTSTTIRPDVVNLQQSVYQRASRVYERLFQSPTPELWNELSEQDTRSPDPCRCRKLECVSGALDLSQSTSIFYTGSALQNHAVTRGTHAEYYFFSEVQDYLDNVRKAEELRGPATLPTIRESKSRESLISRQLHSFSSRESAIVPAIPVQAPREIILFSGQIQSPHRNWLLNSIGTIHNDDLDRICDDDDDYYTLEDLAVNNNSHLLMGFPSGHQMLQVVNGEQVLRVEDFCSPESE